MQIIDSSGQLIFSFIAIFINKNSNVFCKIILSDFFNAALTYCYNDSIAKTISYGQKHIAIIWKQQTKKAGGCVRW